MVHEKVRKKCRPRHPVRKIGNGPCGLDTWVPKVLGKRQKGCQKNFRPRHPGPGDAKINPQRGRAPKAPAPFLGAAEGRPSFLHLPDQGVEVGGFWATFLPFSKHFRRSGVEAAGFVSYLQDQGVEVCTFPALFPHFPALSPAPSATLFLHFFCAFSVPGIYRA